MFYVEKFIIIIIYKDCCFFEIDMFLKKLSCKLFSILLLIIDFYL